MSPDSEAVISVFVQAVMHGLYLGTFVHCFRWLMFEDEGWKTRVYINRSMLAITLLLFLIYTTELWTCFRAVLASVSSNELTTGALDTAINATGAATFLIIDGVLVYRCWIVNAKSKLVICPAIALWLATLTASLLGVFALVITGLEPKKNQLWTRRLPSLYEIFYSCSIATNVYATSAIVFRILKLARDGSSRSARLHTACRILLESGGLYTVTSILTLIVKIVVSGSRFRLLLGILVNVNYSMAGITFNLIFIRTYEQRSNRRNTQKQKLQPRLRSHGGDGSVQDHPSGSANVEPDVLTTVDIEEDD